MPTHSADALRVGFVGIGTMGAPMAANLGRAGHPLALFDVKAEAARTAAEAMGAVAEGSLAALGARSDVVITMLPNSAIVRAALLGSDGGDGVMARLAPGSIVVDMSSSDPLLTRELGELVRERGCSLLDAPVSGGVRKAVAGTLSLMLGGDDERAMERAEPIIAAMGTVFRTGRLGSGHAIKALNNYVSAAGLVAACEAVIVARAFGIDPDRMIDVINASTGRNNSTEIKLKPFVLTGDYRKAGFSLDLMAKDVKVAADLAKRLHLSLPALADTQELWTKASLDLGRGADHTEIHRFLEKVSTTGSEP